MSDLLLTTSEPTLVQVPRKIAMDEVAFWIDNESPGRTQLSAKDGRRSETFACPFNIAEDVQLAMVGYSYTWKDDELGIYKLKRVPPMRHPRKSNWFCTEIPDEGGLLYDGTYTPVDVSRDTRSFRFGPNYEFSKFTANFEPSRILYAGDGVGLDEHYRYVSGDAQGRAEFLKRPRGQFIFTEGPTDQTPFGETFQIERKADFTVMWWQVPEDWVSANGQGVIPFPTKIFECIGAVNSQEIWGYPAGTLMMNKPEILRYPSPLMLTANNGLPLPPQSFYLDIKFSFVWFDPPPGTGEERGHNNFPQLVAGATDAEIQYYMAKVKKADNTAGIMKRFPLVDFTQMFTHVLAA